jgi:hypothetical protein
MTVIMVWSLLTNYCTAAANNAEREQHNRSRVYRCEEKIRNIDVRKVEKLGKEVCSDEVG